MGFLIYSFYSFILCLACMNTVFIECTIANDYTLVVIWTNVSGFVHHFTECDAKGAQFGRQISVDDTVTGCTVAASPPFACEQISPAPIRNSTYECLGGYFAVAERGNCTFAEKAYQAQISGYMGVIIYNYEQEDDPIEMAGDAEYSRKIDIPAFMVGYQCGIALSDRYAYDKGFSFYIRAYWSYNELLRYLIPFVAVVGVCFLIMFSAMVVKLVRDRRRRAKRRLSKKHLKQIPTKKFTSDDPAGTCPICLDEFEVGDRLRILPCSHSYHSACIDPWLLKNRRVCPICKRKVLPRGNASSHSDSENEDVQTTDTNGPALIPSTPERTPLFNNGDANRGVMVGNSTFYGLCDTSEEQTMENGENSSSISNCPLFLSISTQDNESSMDDPTIDVDSRQSLIPELSIQSSIDSFNQPGFVTASSSLREGYANPNFIIDAQEFDEDRERGNTSSTNTGEKVLRPDMV